MANGTEIRALELGEQIAQKQNVYIVDVTIQKSRRHLFAMLLY